MGRRESAPARARRMLEDGLPWRTVKEATGLPDATLDAIAAPILAERELRKTERRILRETQPCPLCGSGHAQPEHYTLMLHNIEVCGVRRDFTADVHFCRCSNPRCPARLIYPRDSDMQAVEAFTQGRFTEPHPYRDADTGLPVYPNAGILVRQVRRLLEQYPAEQVKRLGFKPEAVDRIALEADWDRMVFDPDAFDTTLMCPKCGHRGEYRKAVNPITHRRDETCWWRVGCPHCKTRTTHSFPTRQEAAEAFESGQFDRQPDGKDK